MIRRKSSPDPLNRPIKGMLILHEGDEVQEQLLELMKSLDCEVLNNSSRRMMVRTSLGNLQHIKKCWLAKDDTHALSRELNQCLTQVIIGGRG